jgi:hypothetical protein
MTDESITMRCGECGTDLPASEVTGSPESRTHCPSCGSLARHASVFVHETATVRDGVGYKAKHAGERKPFREAFDYSATQRATGAPTRHERLIDRDQDRYVERVVEEGTERLLHETDHPLSKHKGHGSDRGPRTSPLPQVTTPDASPPGERDAAAP